MRSQTYLWRAAALLVLAPMSASYAQTTDCVSGGATYAGVDRAFSAFAEKEHVPGLIYGVVYRGKLVHCGSLGVRDRESKAPVTFDTVFRIASMTKSFTALAVLKLRDAGKVALDAPAERWIPELASTRYPGSDARDIRVRDLLAHTAGFVTDDPWGDRQLDMKEADLTKLVAGGIPFARMPGTAYEYSNYGYALLGRIVSNASKMPYQAYVDREILRPLGMTSTAWEVARVDPSRRAIGYRYVDGRWILEPVLGGGAFGAIGGLHTSARDYVSYVSFLLAAWSARDPESAAILAKSSRREIGVGSGFPSRNLTADPADPASCGAADVYGFGMRIYNDCRFDYVVTHSGGLPGYGSNVLLLPGYDVGIFAFANRTYAPVSKVVRQAASRLYDEGALAKLESAPTASLLKAKDIVASMYAAGSVNANPAALANNFLLDVDAGRRDRQLAALKVRLGACSEANVVAEHAMVGKIRFQCEYGVLLAKVVLAPVPEPKLQKLELSVEE